MANPRRPGLRRVGAGPRAHRGRSLLRRTARRVRPPALARPPQSPRPFRPAHLRLEERIKEARDHAQRRREYLDFVDRLARLRLREEQGDTPSPEEFAPPPPAEKEEEKDDSDLLETDADGGFEPEDHPQWLAYYCRFKVCEEGCWFANGFRKQLPLVWPHPVEKSGWDLKDEAGNEQD